VKERKTQREGGGWRKRREVRKKLITKEAQKNDTIRQKENERKGEILEESETD
jgi:hypothetical protein